MIIIRMIIKKLIKIIFISKNDNSYIDNNVNDSNKKYNNNDNNNNDD